MQVLRDKAPRGAPSTVVAHFEMWQAPSEAKLLEKYRRAEVTPTGNSVADKDFKKGRMFQTVHDKSGANDRIDLRSVLRRQDWVTHGATTLKNTFAEMELLAQAHEQDLWGRLGNAWMALLLPEGCIVLDRTDGREEYGLVIRTFESAALIWPVARAASDLFELGMGLRLRWKVVLCPDCLHVQPSACLSPLALLELGWDGVRKGPVFNATASPVSGAFAALSMAARVAWRPGKRIEEADGLLGRSGSGHERCARVRAFGVDGVGVEHGSVRRGHLPIRCARNLARPSDA